MFLLPFGLPRRKLSLSFFGFKVLLYGGQKEELLLNLIFPDYPDGNESEDEKSAKEKEADISTSLSGCSYTPRLVNNKGFEPLTFASVAQRSIQLS